MYICFNFDIFVAFLKCCYALSIHCSVFCPNFSGSQAVFLFRRPTRLKKGPTLQCQVKGPKLIHRDIKKSAVAVVERVVYGFTTPLRRQKMID